MKRYGSVIALCLVLITSGCALNRMTPKSVDNQAIEVDVRKAVAGAVTDKTFGIEVNVEGSVVTLSGNVDTSEERSKIVAAARSVDGVSRVIDQLHVK